MIPHEQIQKLNDQTLALLKAAGTARSVLSDLNAKVRPLESEKTAQLKKIRELAGREETHKLIADIEAMSITATVVRIDLMKKGIDLGEANKEEMRTAKIQEVMATISTFNPADFIQNPEALTEISVSLTRIFTNDAINRQFVYISIIQSADLFETEFQILNKFLGKPPFQTKLIEASKEIGKAALWDGSGYFIPGLGTLKAIAVQVKENMNPFATFNLSAINEYEKLYHLQDMYSEFFVKTERAQTVLSSAESFLKQINSQFEEAYLFIKDQFQIQ